MYFLTLDTNVIMEHWKNQKNASIVEKLLELAINGNIDLAITSRIHEDVPNLPLSERINPWKFSTLMKFHRLHGSIIGKSEEIFLVMIFLSIV